MKKINVLLLMFFCFQLCYAQKLKLDSSFGTNGIVTADLGEKYNYSGTAEKVLIQSDGSIYLIIQISNQTIITKRHPDGLTDTTYGVKGFTVPETIYTNDAILQTDGKIVLAGASGGVFAVSRYNTNGTLDNTFGEDGRQTTNFATNEDAAALSATVQSDGKIVVAGKTGYYSYWGALYRIAIVRYNIDGSLDKGFSDDGIKLDETFMFGAANAVAIQKDQKILVATAGDEYSDFHPFLVRYKKNGSLDSSFGNKGRESTLPSGEAKSIAIQSDGKIVSMGGNFNLARFNTDGSLDNSFSSDGMQTTDFDGQIGSSNSISIQSNGKIVVAGHIGAYSDYNFALARYNIDGSLDNSFSGDGKQTTDFEGNNDVANSLAVQSDGKIVVAGSAFVRYDTDGSLDDTFNIGGKLPTNIHSGYTVYGSTKIEKDGKIVAAGTTWNGSNFYSFLVRYNTNGSLDSTFDADGIKQMDLRLFDIANDGKIIVISGDTTIARYNANGSPDHLFSEDGIQQNDFKIASIAIQNDGKIVVAGSASSLDSNYNDSNYINLNFTVARYNIDGSLDNSFSGDGKQTTYFYDLDEDGGGFEHVNSYASFVVIKSSGEIAVIGRYDAYDQYNGSPRGVIAYYNTKGSFDSTSRFEIPSINSYVNGYLISMALGKDNKPVIVSLFDEHPYGYIKHVVLIGPNFSNDLDVPYGYYSVAIQDNGKIIIGGSVLARYNEDGSIDSTFGNNGKQTSAVNINSLAISSNKLYAVGSINPEVGIAGAVARYLFDDESQTPPTVSITTPANNANFGAGAYIKINATAADTNGTISKVEFYNGSALLHTETVAPYGYQWKHVPAGTYTLTVKATDNSGLVSTSAAVNITVVPNIAPTVNITNPANNQTIAGPTTIHLSAVAKDPDGTISKVAFYNGTILLHTETEAPYTYTWPDVPAGNYTLTAVAADNYGVVTTSDVVHISVVPNKAPTVSIINPANDESFTAPATIPLIASAKDPYGSISRVEFYNGTTLIGTQYFSPYTSKWKDVTAGIYTITAKAIDNLGLEAISAEITITVMSNEMIVSNKLSSANNRTSLSDAVSLNVYPNPAGNILNIFTKGRNLNKQTMLSIISASGVVVKTKQLNNSTIQLDVSPLVKGVYIIKLISGDKVMYKQFVKL